MKYSPYNNSSAQNTDDRLEEHTQRNQLKSQTDPHPSRVHIFVLLRVMGTYTERRSPTINGD
ncbi:hypothetical protein DPMN_164926 [Dreissena polymorpha]|uniref:Uncharacterized protein n=1 Tax=Dreissena polymorpha TaxID=45954 RepID=A0A9D4IU52_DREPO|nr:hypothetical protein DPMN_164926 [Dreissena polymorpha]